MDEEQTALVADWLHSLQLVHYTQSFIDNGYDDLEVCKQIGDPDLDAIGVTDPDHRQLIMDSVTLLNAQQGATPLYYILENRGGGSSSAMGVYEQGGSRTLQQGRTQLTNQDIYGEAPIKSSDVDTEDSVTDGYAEGRRAFVTFPKLHLCAIVRDKLAKYGIKLTQKPFINEVSDCWKFDFSWQLLNIMTNT